MAVYTNLIHNFEDDLRSRKFQILVRYFPSVDFVHRYAKRIYISLVVKIGLLEFFALAAPCQGKTCWGSGVFLGGKKKNKDMMTRVSTTMIIASSFFYHVLATASYRLL